MRPTELAGFDRLHRGRSGSQLEERMLLYALVRHLKPHHVIEVGVLEGGTLCWIAAALQDNGFGKVTGMDLEPEFLEQAKRRVGKLGFQRYVNLIAGDLRETLPARPDHSAEVVWVDGGHGYDVAKSDINEAMRIASKLVVVHDSTNVAGVNRACRDVGGGTWLRGFSGLWLRNAG